MNANASQSRNPGIRARESPHNLTPRPNGPLVVGDRLIPLPRRHFKVRDILLEAGAKPERAHP